MASLATKTIQQIVTDYAASAQAACETVLDFTVGSINLAYGEGIADVAAWLQGLIAYVMTLRWASTSFGTDLDSWMADWNFFRLPASIASGNVIFSRYTPTTATVVPTGTQVASADGSLLFNVYADTTNPLYSATAGGYVVPVNVASITVPVQAVAPGKSYNVAINTITMLRVGVSNIDTVTNAVPFSNGKDAEKDAAFRVRFVLYLASLSKATAEAIEYSVTSLGQGLQCIVAVNQDLDGTSDFGMVTVIVDDGSGDIPLATLIQSQYQVEAYRAAGIRTGVFAATPLNANVAIYFEIEEGYSIPTVEGLVASKVANYINGLGVKKKTLPFTMIEHLAYGVPGVTNVTNVIVNGATNDLVAGLRQTIKCSNVAPSAQTES